MYESDSEQVVADPVIQPLSVAEPNLYVVVDG